jgi:excisionase family DNA binding protein
VTRKTDPPPNPRKPDVLTVAEAAELLRVNPKTVYKAVENGQLPVLRFGRIIRIPVHALERMLDESIPTKRSDGS